MRILGISAWYHNSAAALLVDGEVVAAAQEERFSRIKNDASFPEKAIEFCLKTAGISLNELDAVVYYEKPFLKFERILETFYEVAPKGISPFIKAMPTWFREKLFIKSRIHKNLKSIDPGYRKKVKLLFPEHHLSHAASAFYPSGWEEAAILTIDGVGEWATATIGHGKGQNITILKEMKFPHSVGMLYSAFTQFLGFRVNSGEYKLMGLAAYGEPNDEETIRFKSLITSKLVDIFPDGSIELSLPMFGFQTSLSTIQIKKWEQLFGMNMRQAESPFSQQHANLALAIQQVTEAIIQNMAAEAVRLTGCRKLCMAGGVALNGVANGKLERSGIVESLYVQPAAGDAGGALGAALAAHHLYFGQKSRVRIHPLNLLGPSVQEKILEDLAHKQGLAFKQYSDNQLFELISEQLVQGKVIGWCQGRMEFGPRALGNRSILADPRNPDMQRRVNMLVKKRESFRPFAPAILEEHASEYFDLKAASPHMLKVYPLKERWRSCDESALSGHSIQEKLDLPKSIFPAVTHADFSCRVQTVSKSEHPRFHALLTAFHEKTGCPMLLNTSFNERGEPIVATAADAFAAFERTGIDMLVVGNVVMEKNVYR